MPPQTTTPPLSTARKAAGTKAPAGAKIIAASSLAGAGLSESPAQTAPRRRANAWATLIPRPGKCKDLALLEARDLRNDVGGGAKAINPQAPCIAGLPKRAISNQPGTEERSRGDIIERVGKAIAISQHVRG